MRRGIGSLSSAFWIIGQRLKPARAKQGRYLPLSGARVSSPQEAMDALPEGANLFVMNSNYLEEIKRMTDGRYVYHAVDSASFQ